MSTDKPKEEAKRERNRFTSYAMILIVAVAFFAVGFLANGSVTGFVSAIGPQDAGEKAIEFINANMLAPGMSASLVSIEEVNGVYELELAITDETGSNTYTSYMTKDGTLLFVQAIDLTEEIEPLPTDQTTQAPAVTKSDNPTADVFIMSYCPYGLQMLKALLPAWELLDDKADINLRFVYYIMHGQTETDENTRMYCIQKEQKDKLFDYLNCFVEAGDSEGCLAQAGVDTAALDSCMAAADTEFSITANMEDEASWLSGRYPLYNVDKALNEQYGVGGSPTVVINGQQASVSRSPEAVKQAICDSFNTPPAECSQTLDTASATPGLGTTTGSTTTSGGCGA